MRLVIDSNKLQSDDLRSYLAQSAANEAVLTDFAAMEAYKGNTLASIFRSMEVLSDYPAQVVVLKGSEAVTRMRGRGAGLQRRLVDEEQTAQFHVYVRGLKLAKAGAPELTKQLVAHGDAATAHFSRMLIDARAMGAVFSEMAKDYTKQERQAVLLGDDFPPGFMDKAAKSVLGMVAHVLEQHPGRVRTPSFAELPNTFLFRCALGLYLLALDWVARSGYESVRPERLRNDFVDVTFAAYASYFDGILSADEKLLRLHQELRTWLSGVFDCPLPSGLGYEWQAQGGSKKKG